MTSWFTLDEPIGDRAHVQLAFLVGRDHSRTRVIDGTMSSIRCVRPVSDRSTCARGHALVLHDLHTRAVARDLGAVLDRLHPPDVEANRRVELQSTTTGRCLG